MSISGLIVIVLLLLGLVTLLVIARRINRRPPDTTQRPRPVTPARRPAVAPAATRPPAEPAAPAHARLGIDFGTSNTVAALRTGDGRRVPVLFDGSPLLPSAVFATDDGRLLVGRDATHLARTSPDRFEPTPKRCIDDGQVLLGDRAYPVVDLVAAVLARVLDEARRVANGPVPAVTLTHPAAWARHRRETLLAAAAQVGLPAVTTVPEPVAAARFLTGVAGIPMNRNAVAVVYDFGGGTFDATVLRMTADGYTVLATEGLPDAGGIDVDAAVVAHVGATYAARDPAAWNRLTAPATPADRRARWTLWDDVRHAKEMLSRTPSTTVHLPLFDEEVLITRDQLELLARPVLDRTVAATRSALAAAGANAPEAVFLVGGSSRIPLAATLLHRAFGVAPVAIESPESVVAEGSLLAGVTR